MKFDTIKEACQLWVPRYSFLLCILPPLFQKAQGGKDYLRQTSF